MIIFVSHKDSDTLRASDVAKGLRDNGHQVYMDAFDDGLKHGTADLADYLRVRLAQCDALIAVVSRNTQGSWWVPWEIGVATERDYPLGTFQCDDTTPPDYLKKWPILKSMADLGLFADLVKSVQSRTTTIRLSQSKSLEESRKMATREFHQTLKAKLGQ